jgi:hypothetical protein
VSSDLDDIRQQMAQIRFNLHSDVSGVITETERMFDWRSYLRSAPWLWSAVALGAGYLLVPRRRRTIPTASQVVHEIADQLPTIQAAYGQPSAPVRADSGGFLGLTPGRIAWWAIKSASPMLLAAAQSYAMPLVEQWMAQKLQPQGPRPSQDPVGYGAEPEASRYGGRRF